VTSGPSPRGASMPPMKAATTTHAAITAAPQR
jgi:hypothetical protein